MDILVMLEENPERSPVLAHVNSVPSPLNSQRPSRDVVTLYGVPNAELLALALAATVECHRAGDERSDTIRHVGVWPERGAVGDAAWRDELTGQLVSRDLDIPLDVLCETSQLILTECGQGIRQLIAGLSMSDWPEGQRRAINFSLSPIFEVKAAARSGDDLLDLVREAEGLTFDVEGD